MPDADRLRTRSLRHRTPGTVALAALHQDAAALRAEQVRPAGGVTGFDLLVGHRLPVALAAGIGASIQRFVPIQGLVPPARALLPATATPR